MKRHFRLLCLFFATVWLLFSCSGVSDLADAPDASGGGSTENGTVTPPTDFAQTDEQMFTERDKDTAYHTAQVQITLNGDSATASSDAVQITGSTVQITEEATYIITGTLKNGQIIVNAPDTAKPQLVLKGASVHSETSAPLYVLGADKVFVTLEKDTVNSLSSGGSFVAIDENNIDGALFSKQDLTLNGEGTLSVTSPAGHGIVCKDDLTLVGGTYRIEAAAHALDANDSIRLSGVTLTATAGKDGLHAENTEDTAKGFVYLSSGTLELTAGGDGISASAFLQLENGTVRAKTGGGAGATLASDASAKGLKATSAILIRNGSYTLDCADDAVHANASITMSGGSFTIATGDDGFHADETLAISGGNIQISRSYEGLEALDIAISGGEIVLVASDDGINAAGGTDQSGFGGMMGGDQFGRPGGRPGGGGRDERAGGGMMGGGSAGDGSIVISGGTLYIEASGDGIDANGTLSITGGHTTVCGPTQGDTATLDYDVSGEITGGTFIGTGGAGMAQSFSNAAQGVIAVRVGSQGAGTAITLTDGDGKVLLTHTPKLSFAVVILSSPEMQKGTEYTLSIGTLTETVEAQ